MERSIDVRDEMTSTHTGGRSDTGQLVDVRRSGMDAPSPELLEQSHS